MTSDEERSEQEAQQNEKDEEDDILEGNLDERPRLSIPNSDNASFKLAGAFLTNILTDNKGKERRRGSHPNLKFARVFNLVPYKTTYLLSATARRIRANEGLQARSDDILVSSFPKSGTTWTQAMVQLILYEKLSAITNIGMDFSDIWCHPGQLTPEAIEARPSPRLIKTHLPRTLYPVDIIEKKCKVVYVYRNPKDVIVSMYHFCKGVPMMQNSCAHESFEAFAEAFMQGKVIYGPFFQNIASFWEHRFDSNLLMLSYDDISRDPRGNVKRLALFLGKDLDEEKISGIVHSTSFDEMKKSDLTQQNDEKGEDTFHFLRCGKTEQWKAYFSPELLKRVEKWIGRHLATRELEGFSFDNPNYDLYDVADKTY